ncbi:hypothetical protein KC19_12G047000 [Ceratodon purpureus]|uniref:RING-type domain-containing protein n=1 Tax=Ceratodon purpureus TaxID=3225 RepID=A0A8T0G4A7_CERPU|nr:hypothetical protein KC19_12G047000 [Ceratodon purpureus]
MKCNSCWKNLEGRSVATTCGHIFCTEDAQKILGSVDATCPLCEQMLSKSMIKAVDMAPSDEWINMVMAGMAPQSSILNLFVSGAEPVYHHLWSVASRR